MKGRGSWRVAVGLALIVTVLCGVAGCENKQLKERNLALEAEAQRQELEIARLQRELDEAKAARPVEPTTGKGKVPDFGKDVEVTEDKGVVTVVLPDKILFAPGQAVLKPESKAVLQRVAGVLKTTYPTEEIRVEGHTDSDPIRVTKKLWKSNWELSSARALAVVHYLVEQSGLDPKRVYAAGFGEHRPVASNSTAAGKAKNRRVQIVIVPKR